MIKKLLSIVSLIGLSFNGYSQVIWGVGSSNGLADAEFSNPFVNATSFTAGDNVGAWTSRTIFDGNGSPGAAYWVRSLTGTSQGAYFGTQSSMNSPSQANGVALFDSDYMDNGGTQGAFGMGSSPAPHKGELISPRIDLTGCTNSVINVKFESYFRNYQITELSVAISTDDGATWSAPVDYNTAATNDVFRGIKNCTFPTVTAGVTNLTQCRMKLVFNGDYYYAMVDDIAIEKVIVCSLADQTLSPSNAAICGSGNTNINMASSESGILYTLRDNSNNAQVGASQFGTGSALSFPTGTINTTTTYNVYSQAGAVSQNSLSFVGNAASSNVNLGNSINSVLAGTNSITVEAWVYPTSTYNLQTIVGNYQDEMQFLLRLDNLAPHFWISSPGSTNFSVAVGSTTVPLNTWSHVAGTWDGTTIRVFLNGVQIGTEVKAGVFPSMNQNVKIGGGLNNGTEYFTGNITDVRIWNIVRSQAEIDLNKAKCLDFNTSGLLALYTMNDGSGSSSLRDFTGHGYNGTLAGMDASTVWQANVPTLTCDACDLQMTQLATVTINDVPTTSVSGQTNVSCNGGFNGDATINTPTGGGGAYVYDWTPGTPTGDGTTSISGLTAGTWMCTVTDANLCTTQAVFTITEPAALSITPDSQTNIACNGGFTGSATINSATGGTASYIYDWTPGTPTGDGTTSISGLNVGTWTCTVTDANSCTSQTVFTIAEPTALIATSTANNILCNGGTTSVTVSATGGTAAYTGIGTFTVTANSYTYTVTDANGCNSQTTITITEPAAIDITTITSNETITANATSMTYQWIDCNNLNTAISGETNQSYTASANGSYAVVISDGTCSDTSTCVSINSVGLNSHLVISNSELIIYPNPSSGKFAIAGLSIGSKIEVYNAIGEVILRMQTTEEKTIIDLQNKANGVYFIKSNNQYTHKLVKQD